MHICHVLTSYLRRGVVRVDFMVGKDEIDYAYKCRFHILGQIEYPGEIDYLFGIQRSRV